MLRVNSWLRYAALLIAIQVIASPATAALSSSELLEQATKYIDEIQQQIDSIRKEVTGIESASLYATAADSASTLGCVKEISGQMLKAEKSAQMARDIYEEIVQTVNLGQNINHLDIETLRDQHASVHAIRNSIVSCSFQSAEMSSTIQNKASADITEMSSKSVIKSSPQISGTTTADVPASGVQAAMPTRLTP